MNADDDRYAQQNSMGSQQNARGQDELQQQQGSPQARAQGSPQGSASGSQQEAFSQGGGQQHGGQQGVSPGSQAGTQGDAQGGGQGGGMGRRGGLGGMPSLFGSRSNPMEMLRRLDEDMDRMFHQLWGGGRSLMRGRGGDMASMWVPQVEVREEGGKLHVCADLPGLRKEDVKLRIEGDQLILQGERQSSREEGQQGSSYYHTERSYGSFYRTIPLPEGVDPQTAQASFKDGVLDVTFEAPRAAQQHSRQIEIR
jgi:HSP20 family protein